MTWTTLTPLKLAISILKHGKVLETGKELFYGFVYVGLLLELREDSHIRVFVEKICYSGGFSNLKPCLQQVSSPLQLVGCSL